MSTVTETLDKLLNGFEAFKASSGTKFEQLKKEFEEELKDLRGRTEELESRRGQPTAGDSPVMTKALAAFNEFLHKNNPAALDEKSFSIVGGESAGAGMVPSILADEILNKAVDEEPILDEVRRTDSSSGDYTRIVNRKGSASGWVGETGARSETGTSAFRSIAPPGGELFAYPKASSWMVQDSRFDVGSIVIEDTGEEFATRLADAVFFGTGADQPLGMLTNTPVTTADTVPDTRNRDTLKYVTGVGSPNELDGDLLIKALFDLKAAYRRNAVWCMNSVSLAACRSMKDLNGRYIWESGGFGASIDAPDGLLLGKRVVVSERLQNVGSGAGNFPILVGDFRRGYELVSVGGMFITLDANITAPGFTKWYVRRRFLGRLADNSALRAIRT